MYGSTMDALASLYPKLQPGGFCVIDDYDLRGARQATDDFRAAEEITTPLTAIDQSSVFWRKPQLSASPAV
jgi:O-methyltransferase